MLQQKGRSAGRGFVERMEDGVWTGGGMMNRTGKWGSGNQLMDGGEFGGAERQCVKAGNVQSFIGV